MNSGEMVYATAGNLPAGRESVRPIRPVIHAFPTDKSDLSRIVPVFTFVLWVSFATVGGLGLILPYVRPQAPKAAPVPTNVEMLNVELSNDPLPDNTPLPLNALASPPPPDAVAQPNLPQPMAVAEPSAAVAFALPVDGATQIVPAAQAAYSRARVAPVPVSATPAVQRLTYGAGAGRQPAPDYPLRAQDQGQQGVVDVRFTVGENGRVAAAETANPSPWPLLNESALRTVRNRWRFPAGPMRVYQVAIRFELPK